MSNIIIKTGHFNTFVVASDKSGDKMIKKGWFHIFRH